MEALKQAEIHVRDFPDTEVVIIFHRKNAEGADAYSRINSLMSYESLLAALADAQLNLVYGDG